MNENIKNYYIFSTCRLCYLDHPNIKHIKLLKKLHSNHYTINNNNLFTQPVNYTVKLRDVLDSILYLKGLYFNNLDYKIFNEEKPENIKLFLDMFFTFSSAEYVHPNTYPLDKLPCNNDIVLDKCVIEVWNLEEYIFKSGIFINKNLPFKINSVHRVNNQGNQLYSKDDFEIKKYSYEETHYIIKYIKKLINCPLLIIGPYLSKTRIEDVNNKRKQTQTILKNICEIENITYFDMTNEIIKDQNILISNVGKESDETHFTEKGNKILSKVIYDFLIN